MKLQAPRFPQTNFPLSPYQEECGSQQDVPDTTPATSPHIRCREDLKCLIWGRGERNGPPLSPSLRAMGWTIGYDWKGDSMQ